MTTSLRFHAVLGLLALLVAGGCKSSSSARPKPCENHGDCTEKPGGRCVVDRGPQDITVLPGQIFPDKPRYCAYPSSDCGKPPRSGEPNLAFAGGPPRHLPTPCLVRDTFTRDPALYSVVRPPRPCTDEVSRDIGRPDLRPLACPAGSRCVQEINANGQPAQTCVDAEGLYHGPLIVWDTDDPGSALTVGRFHRGERRILCELSYVLRCYQSNPDGSNDQWVREPPETPVAHPLELLDLPRDDVDRASEPRDAGTARAP
jgi:hypothetical protein